MFKRSLILQALLIAALILSVYYLICNISYNLESQTIATGFAFLWRKAGFEITESLLPYSSAKTYAYALLVGILNTLKVAFTGIIATVILGTIIGIARLSGNWIVSRLAKIYIEIFRNIPILLQLFFWYAVFYQVFPAPADALSFGKAIFLCNRGVFLAVPKMHTAYFFMGISFFIGCIAVSFLRKSRYILFIAPIIILLPSIIIWLFYGMPFEIDLPVYKRFNFEGGVNISPEFASLLLGLILYTSSFVAEIVRSGILSVRKGQKEAAMSLGLNSRLTLIFIILPQALRVIIPPLTSQMLDLTKNSTLAVAIGYPDFVSVANTTINQTGQAIEGVAMIMIVYLFFSLITSAFMNWYNKRIALVGERKK